MEPLCLQNAPDAVAIQRRQKTKSTIAGPTGFQRCSVTRQLGDNPTIQYSHDGLDIFDLLLRAGQIIAINHN
jgi:hypothetical protein